MYQEALIVAISTLGPVVGSGIGVLKKPSETYIKNMLCFAAGIMMAISFLELIPEAIHLSSTLMCAIGLVIGAAMMWGIDMIIPHIHPRACSQEQGQNLERTATYLIMGIFMHNFPEGMAIAIGAVTDVRNSMVIAIAIAIHNIPEGICTSAPYYHSNGSRLKSFFASSITAFPILFGYITARFIFVQIPTDVMGIIIASTAGLMIYITADELLPAAQTGSNHRTIFWFITGILFVILLNLL